MAKLFILAPVLTCLMVLYVSPTEQKLCSRMYFYHGKESKAENVMPYSQLEGVYAIHQQGSHPTLKHEERNYFFEYHKSFNVMYFSELLNGKRFYMEILMIVAVSQNV